MKIFAQNYRGFEWFEIDLSKVNFLVGDNSSGKSSIIYLIDAMSHTDLNEAPRLNEDYGVGAYDYFSPFFDFRDVVLGYSSHQDGIDFVKIITVKRTRDFTPEIVKCSYYAEGSFVSFKTRANDVRAKWRTISFTDNKSLIDLHNKENGYNKVEADERIPLGNPSALFAFTNDRHLKDTRKVFRHATKYLLDQSRIVSPIRALPEKFYTFRRKFAASGIHFATLWSDVSEVVDDSAFDLVNKFGKESGLFDRIKVGPVSRRVPESPLIVSVEKKGREFLLNQVGVGVSQVVPILVESLFAASMPGTPILVQQPELHLHPVAQAALGSYFFGMSAEGLRPVIETHSSFLLDRFRADLRDASLKKNAKGADGESSTTDSLPNETAKQESDLTSKDIALLFFRNSTSGNSVTNIVVNDDGSYENDPDEFHSFFVDELVRTMF